MAWGFYCAISIIKSFVIVPFFILYVHESHRYYGLHFRSIHYCEKMMVPGCNCFLNYASYWLTEYMYYVLRYYYVPGMRFPKSYGKKNPNDRSNCCGLSYPMGDCM